MNLNIFTRIPSDDKLILDDETERSSGMLYITNLNVESKYEAFD